LRKLNAPRPTARVLSRSPPPTSDLRPHLISLTTKRGGARRFALPSAGALIGTRRPDHPDEPVAAKRRNILPGGCLRRQAARTGGNAIGRPENNRGTVPIFAQRKWDCPLPNSGSHSSGVPHLLSNAWAGRAAVSLVSSGPDKRLVRDWPMSPKPLHLPDFCATTLGMGSGRHCAAARLIDNGGSPHELIVAGKVRDHELGPLRC
jgi:hypothetical protein